MLSINSDINSIKLNSSLSNATMAMNIAMERMSTGYKINSAKDDAAGLAVSSGLSKQVNANKQAQKNAQDGASMLNLAGGSINNMTKMLHRIRDLALQAASETYGDDSRKAINTEAQALTEQIYQQKNSTNFNGVKVFGEGEDGLINAVTKQTVVPSGYTAITNAQEFVDKINANKSGKFILMEDIDFSGINYTAITDFAGELEGNGCTIKNLTIDKPTEELQALFGTALNGAKFQNIILKDFFIKGSNGVGALVGGGGVDLSDNITIDNVAVVGGAVYGETNGMAGGLAGGVIGDVSNSYATNEVHGESIIGGLIGIIQGSVVNSHATGNVSGDVSIGGLIGGYVTTVTITKCYATGNVSGGSVNVGGLVGTLAEFSTINSSYSTGSVNGSEAIGGLVGYMENSTINSSYSTGSVSGDNAIGGLIGALQKSSTINSSYSTGHVNGITCFGGLVGFLDNSEGANSILNSFWDKDKSAQNIGIGYTDGGPSGTITLTGLNSTQMNDPTYFTNAGWSNSIWEFNAGNTPALKGLYAPNIKKEIRLQVGIDGSESSFINIDSTLNMNGFRVNLSTRENAIKALDDIDKLLNTFISKNAELGSTTNRLQSVIEMHSVSIINLSSANSAIQDADIAKESANFVKSQILQNVSASLLSQSSGASSKTALKLITNSRLR